MSGRRKNGCLLPVIIIAAGVILLFRPWGREKEDFPEHQLIAPEADPEEDKAPEGGNKSPVDSVNIGIDANNTPASDSGSASDDGAVIPDAEKLEDLPEDLLSWGALSTRKLQTPGTSICQIWTLTVSRPFTSGTGGGATPSTPGDFWASRAAGPPAFPWRRYTSRGTRR